MNDFNATLLREKFVISDAVPGKSPDKVSAPVIALSNRIVLPMAYADGKYAETLVVRSQNMHNCLRMAARIVQEFQDTGPILNRAAPFDWRFAWLSLVKGFESKYNPNRWIAVYHKGKLVFEDGEVPRHSFLDIIEQCDARNPDNYEKAVLVAEDAFKQAGKVVTITHDSNVAMVLNFTPPETKCGIIVRGPTKTMTFNYTARPKAGRVIKISQCLSAAAAFLEGVQLAFAVGMTRQKEAFDMLDNGAEDLIKLRDSSEKLGRLNGAVQQFENLLEVSYRPERPDFARLVDTAQAHAKITLAAELKRRIAEGEMEQGEWVS